MELNLNLQGRAEALLHVKPSEFVLTGSKQLNK